MQTVSIIICAYNEAESIPNLAQQLEQLASLPYQFEILVIDDGSLDNTKEQIERYNWPQAFTVKYIEFSRNFGKEAALSCGLKLATGEAAIPIDADLQHPVGVIPQMLEQWQAGYHMVVAVETQRESINRFQQGLRRLAHKLIVLASEYPYVESGGDFRLLDRKIIDVLNLLPENQRFMKGLYGFAGFEVTKIEYQSDKRLFGNSKWTQWQLLKYLLLGITSVSTKPLRFAFLLCSVFSLFFILYIIITFVEVMIYGRTTQGYASLMIVMLGGFSLCFFCIGIIGEYISRLFMEVKHRPLYVIKSMNTVSQHKKN